MMHSKILDNNLNDLKDKKKIIIKIIWGIALLAAGIGVFFRIPEVIPRVEKIKQFSSVIVFIRFCFYFLGIMLIGGGTKRIYDNYQKLKEKKSN